MKYAWGSFRQLCLRILFILHPEGVYQISLSLSAHLISDPSTLTETYKLKGQWQHSWIHTLKQADKVNYTSSESWNYTQMAHYKQTNKQTNTNASYVLQFLRCFINLQTRMLLSFTHFALNTKASLQTNKHAEMSISRVSGRVINRSGFHLKPIIGENPEAVWAE